jgi:hypothetical protein
LTPVTDGTACGDDAGTCQDGSCQVACSEQGIRDAIAAGGGPYTFACDGDQRVVTTERIVIDNDVILDGEGKLTVDGNANDAGEGHTVFTIAFSDIAVELRGIGVTGGGCPPSLEGAKQATNGCFATGILVDNLHTASQATLTLANCRVWNNELVGIYQNVGGTLTLLNTTVSGSGLFNVHNQGGVLTVINSTISNGGAFQPEFAAGIRSTGPMTMLNSTVSGSEGVGIRRGTMTLTNCTVSGNARGGIDGDTVTLARTIVDGDCTTDVIVSNGYNIESPGNTCGFDPDGTDQVDVSAEQLSLGELADNGGPTMTHALGVDSVALDRIPEVDCEVETDQRGEPRPVGDGCDVGSFERQPEDP